MCGPTCTRGKGNVTRQIAAERQGLQLRIFCNLDELPAQAWCSLELITEGMDACANVFNPTPKGLVVVRMDGKQRLPRQLVLNHLEVIVL